MSYEMKGARISSFQPSSGADLPTECITFSFAKIIMTYVEMEHGTGRVRGNIEYEYDLRDNTSR